MQGAMDPLATPPWLRHHQLGPTGSARANLGIFWDIENCSLPSHVAPDTLASNIRRALQQNDATMACHVTSFTAFGDFHLLPRRIREGCQRTGINLVDVPSGRKDAADKAILADLFLFALDHPPPSAMLLISGDVDFSTSLHKLSLRGYSIFLLVPCHVGVSRCLTSAAKFVWDWGALCRGEGLVPSPTVMLPRVSGYQPVYQAGPASIGPLGPHSFHPTNQQSPYGSCSLGCCQTPHAPHVSAASGPHAPHVPKSSARFTHEQSTPSPANGLVERRAHGDAAMQRQHQPNLRTGRSQLIPSSIRMFDGAPVNQSPGALNVDGQAASVQQQGHAQPNAHPEHRPQLVPSTFGASRGAPGRLSPGAPNLDEENHCVGGTTPGTGPRQVYSFNREPDAAVDLATPEGGKDLAAQLPGSPPGLPGHFPQANDHDLTNVAPAEDSAFVAALRDKPRCVPTNDESGEQAEGRGAQEGGEVSLHGLAVNTRAVDLGSVQRQLCQLVYENGGKLLLVKVPGKFHRKYGTPFFLSDYGVSKIAGLCDKDSGLEICGKGSQKYLVLVESARGGRKEQGRQHNQVDTRGSNAPKKGCSGESESVNSKLAESRGMVHEQPRQEEADGARGLEMDEQHGDDGDVGEERDGNEGEGEGFMGRGKVGGRGGEGRGEGSARREGSDEAVQGKSGEAAGDEGGGGRGGGSTSLWHAISRTVSLMGSWAPFSSPGQSAPQLSSEGALLAEDAPLALARSDRGSADGDMAAADVQCKVPTGERSEQGLGSQINVKEEVTSTATGLETSSAGETTGTPGNATGAGDGELRVEDAATAGKEHGCNGNGESDVYQGPPGKARVVLGDTTEGSDVALDLSRQMRTVVVDDAASTEKEYAFNGSDGSDVDQGSSEMASVVSGSSSKGSDVALCLTRQLGTEVTGAWQVEPFPGATGVAASTVMNATSSTLLDHGSSMDWDSAACSVLDTAASTVLNTAGRRDSDTDASCEGLEEKTECAGEGGYSTEVPDVAQSVTWQPGVGLGWNAEEMTTAELQENSECVGADDHGTEDSDVALDLMWQDRMRLVEAEAVGEVLTNAGLASLDLGSESSMGPLDPSINDEERVGEGPREVGSLGGDRGPSTFEHCEEKIGSDSNSGRCGPNGGPQGYMKHDKGETWEGDSGSRAEAISEHRVTHLPNALDTVKEGVIGIKAEMASRKLRVAEDPCDTGMDRSCEPPPKVILGPGGKGEGVNGSYTEAASGHQGGEEEGDSGRGWSCEGEQLHTVHIDEGLRATGDMEEEEVILWQPKVVFTRKSGMKDTLMTQPACSKISELHGTAGKSSDSKVNRGQQTGGGSTSKVRAVDGPSVNAACKLDRDETGKPPSGSVGKPHWNHPILVQMDGAGGVEEGCSTIIGGGNPGTVHLDATQFGKMHLGTMHLGPGTMHVDGAHELQTNSAGEQQVDDTRQLELIDVEELARVSVGGLQVNSSEVGQGRGAGEMPRLHHDDQLQVNSCAEGLQVKGAKEFQLKPCGKPDEVEERLHKVPPASVPVPTSLPEKTPETGNVVVGNTELSMSLQPESDTSAARWWWSWQSFQRKSQI